MSTPHPALAGLALVALLLPTIGAHAEVSAPVSLGRSQVDAPYGRLAPEPSTRTISVKTSREVPHEGSILVASVADVLAGNNLTLAGCSDSAGNTYHVDVARFSGDSGLNAIVCSTHGIAAPLPSGATITVTWSPGPVLAADLRMEAFFVTGLLPMALDKTAASDVGCSGSPSSGSTVTTAQAAELLFGVIVDFDDGVSTAKFTPGSLLGKRHPFHPPRRPALGGPARHLQGGHRLEAESARLEAVTRSAGR
jgi:hypothetical protein